MTARKHFTAVYIVVACSNRINMISIQCHRVGEWSAGKPECGNCIVPVWGNHDYAGLNEVAIPFNLEFIDNGQFVDSPSFDDCPGHSQ